MFAPIFAPILALGVGDYGGAIMTVVSLAALAVFGSVTFAFAAHAFFTIADGTASGQKEISWISEPIIDRLGKSALMAWVLFICVAPAFVIAKLTAGGGLAGAILTLSLAGLILPITLLSMQSVGSWLAVVHPEAVTRLLKRPDHLAFYYLTMIPIHAATIAGWYLLLRVKWGLLLAAVILAYTWLAGARIFGRLAHCVGRVGLKQKKRPRIEDEVAYYQPPRPDRRPSNPRAVATDDENYGLSDGEPVTQPNRPSLKRVWVEEGADDPYALSGGPENEPQPPLPATIAQPSEFEMKLAAPRRPVTPPPHPWIVGTYDFPIWPSNWVAMIWLGTGMLVCGYFARAVFGG